MQIDMQEVLEYIEQQKAVFSKLLALMPDNPFNSGIIEGLNLVKQYVKLRQENEGNRIAEALDK